MSEQSINVRPKIKYMHLPTDPLFSDKTSVYYTYRQVFVMVLAIIMDL